MPIVEPVVDIPGRYHLANPATGAPLASFNAASREEVQAAVARARVAQAAWATTSIKQRAAVVQRALAILVEKQDAYAEAIIAETGRSAMETVMMEILPGCDAMHYWSRRAPRTLGDRRVGLHLLRHKSATVRYRPLGVVGIITPWNGPFILALNPATQALLAGNAVIVKPSEVTPWSSQLVEKLYADAGLPPGLLQVILGDGATGAALVESGVNKISFTGSVATGRKVGESCGRNLIPCTLELGGKDPMIVCADADLDRAAGGAVFGSLMNNGQFCSSTERIYVVEAVAEAFEAKVKAIVEKLTNATSGEFDLGPFISPRQMEIVSRHVEDARARGATVCVGGKQNTAVGPHYYSATLLTGVNHDMAVMTEESFGPIVAIQRVKDEAEAITRANEGIYGLGATVWTKDKARGFAIASQIDAGSVVVNDSAITYGALEVPFGGVRQSGVGHVNGEDALRAFCHAQPILVDRFGLKDERVWYPYTLAKLDELRKMIRYVYGTFLRYLLY